MAAVAAAAAVEVVEVVVAPTPILSSSGDRLLKVIISLSRMSLGSGWVAAWLKCHTGTILSAWTTHMV